MRIALVSDCYPPRLGGIESHVQDLATRLSHAGHQVHVFTATPDGSGYGVIHQVSSRSSGSSRVVIHRLTLPLPGQIPVNPLARQHLRSQLDHFDVVHVHLGVVSPFAFDALNILSGLTVPTTCTWHCLLGGFAPLWRARPVFARWARSGVGMNAVSSVLAAQIRPLLRGAGSVQVLPNGIDYASWAQVAARRAAKNPEPNPEVVRVVASMRLARRKRPAVLLRIIKEARSLSAVPLDFTLFGDGPWASHLDRYLEKNQMKPWARLGGRKDRAGLQAAYEQADIYVFPALMESFGIAALEARAAGLPVIGRTGTGASDFITPQVNGLLADSDPALAQALADLAENHAWRGQMARFNAQHPPAQDWDKTLELTLGEYARAQGLRTGSRRR